MPNGNGIEWLLQVNAENSAKFLADQKDRQNWRKEHRTQFKWLKCMDGRLLASDWTETPMGIIAPMRNLGGIFDIGWPHFHSVVHEWKGYADDHENDSVLFCSYHYSRGSKQRGCKGHGYNDERALRYSAKMKKDWDEYSSAEVRSGKTDTRLFPILVGMETDREALILHGEDGEAWDLSEIDDTSDDGLWNLAIGRYPSIYASARNVIGDLVELFRGNTSHIARIKELCRPPQEMDHRESILAVGRGFDWLHLPNKALIVGPWQDNLAEPIATAARLIQNNLESGILGDSKIVLLTSGVWRDPGGEQVLAKDKSLYLMKTIAMPVIRESFSKLLPRLELLVITTDLNTRKVEVIERQTAKF